MAMLLFWTAFWVLMDTNILHGEFSAPKKLEWNLGALVIYVTFIPDSSHSEYPTNRNKSQMTTLNEGKTKPDATGFLLLLRNMVRYLKASPSLVFQWFAVLHNREGWVVIYRCQWSRVLEIKGNPDQHRRRMWALYFIFGRKVYLIQIFLLSM